MSRYFSNCKSIFDSISKDSAIHLVIYSQVVVVIHLVIYSQSVVVSKKECYMETVENRVFGEVIHLMQKGGPDLMSETSVTASWTLWICQNRSNNKC